MEHCVYGFAWSPNPLLQPELIQRPPTSKPKAPDEIEFEDESVAADYRKMFEKMKEMEAMLQRSKVSNGHSESNANKPTEDCNDSDSLEIKNEE